MGGESVERIESVISQYFEMDGSVPQPVYRKGMESVWAFREGVSSVLVALASELESADLGEAVSEAVGECCREFSIDALEAVVQQQIAERVIQHVFYSVLDRMGLDADLLDECVEQGLGYRSLE